jgi:hypothetical protein
MSRRQKLALSDLCELTKALSWAAVKHAGKKMGILQVFLSLFHGLEKRRIFINRLVVGLLLTTTTQTLEFY